MKQPIINHTSIKGNPLIEIVTEQMPGINCGKKYGINYNHNSRNKSSIEHYGIKHNVAFPLERIIKDYITHYGITKAIEILIGKGIINTENRAIIII
jgi:hypothetical protein